MGAIAYSSIGNDTSEPVPEPELSVETEDLTYSEHPLYQAFQYDDLGFERGSVNFAFNLACQNTSERYQNACEAALEIQQTMGADAYVIMAIYAMETGFRPIATSTQDAQGPKQIQAAYLVTETRRHIEELSFYQNLEIDDPRRIALDDLLNNTDNESERAVRIGNAFETGEFANEHDRVLHELRYDWDFAFQLVTAVSIENTPTIATSNFTGSWEEDYDARMNAALAAYAYHNMGPNGSRYQMAIIDNPDFQMLTPNSPEIEAVLATLREDNGWEVFSAESAARNARANQPVFASLDNTFYGCVMFDTQNSIEVRMEGFIDNFQTAMTVSTQSFTDYLASGVDVTDTYFSDDRAPSQSPPPKMRPDNLETFATTRAETIIETPTWHSEHCGERNTDIVIALAPQTSMMPVMRPSPPIETSEVRRPIANPRREPS